ncbi:hypothetical protein COT65_01850 [Candidatus Shapirobacteria bacterium CG09_land_8_20_14_0_10_47_13]|uniref:Uncharacterized protein n=1 Tax=Candidatus Shapirobacteria bacterium CG09_land_8_20_14_0_10_47_13 TaxID=1974481 RepID=A0A2H0WPM0_9BACT|nr:MAG: hypothetical protein COT65_01850 [Candidatus Shapirobacteria bacterium CG09_land_8_20_14_0_10_47_13]
MKNNFKLGKEVLILTVMTLLTIITWLAFDVYRVSQKTTIAETTREQMRVLNPGINKDVITALKNNLSPQ